MEFLQFGWVATNPSLTRRVMIIPVLFDQFVRQGFEERNFKTEAAIF